MAKKKKKQFDWAKWGPIMFDAICAFNLNGVLELARAHNIAFRGTEDEPPTLLNATDLISLLRHAMEWLIERDAENWQNSIDSGTRKNWAVTNGYRDTAGRLVVEHEFIYYKKDSYMRVDDDMGELYIPEPDCPAIRIVLDKCDGEHYFDINFIMSSQTW